MRIAAAVAHLVTATLAVTVLSGGLPGRPPDKVGYASPTGTGTSCTAHAPLVLGRSHSTKPRHSSTIVMNV
jgi:hypothetical protein